MGGGGALTAAVSAASFVDRLLAAGFDFFAGVPCSLVGAVIAELERRGRYLGETREDAALGVAAGAYLGGRRPVVIMQNSGLGVSLNALGSLHILYELPVLLVITWRGYGEGRARAPRDGRCPAPLLDLFAIPHRDPDATTVLATSTGLAARSRDAQPVALLVKPGLFTEHA